MRISPEERFWANIDTSGPGSCHFWMGARNEDGYGIVLWGGKARKAHRIAWMLTFGEIPKGMCIMHLCNRPPCCNVAHLQLGSHADNMAHMSRAGRSNAGMHLNVGATQHLAKLTDGEVHAIRRMYASGKYTQRKLAKIFGVSRRSIGHVLSRETWRHVD